MSVASLGASPSRPPRAPRPLSTHSSTHRNSPNISGNPPELHVSPPLPSISTLALSVKANHSSSHVVTPLKRGASLPKDGSPYEEHTVATRTPSETGHDPSPSETFFTASVFRYQTTTDSGIAGLSRKNSSIRDSSETHAVTIYDMYSEEGPSMGREDMSRNETRSFSSRPASSFFDPNISDDYRPSGNSLRASVSLLPYAQPPTPPDPQQRTSLTNSVRTARESFQQSFQQSSRVTTPINALEPPRPPSRTRLSNSASYGSLRPNFSRPRTPSNPTAPPHLNSSHSSLNLPPGTSTSTPARPTQTAAPFKVSSNRSRPSTSHSHSQRGSTEEPDSFHVRVTYARLEAQGVEGDGFDEGVERTRTKPANASSTSIRPAEAPLDPVDKGVDLTGRQVELLQDLDR